VSEERCACALHVLVSRERDEPIRPPPDLAAQSAARSGEIHQGWTRYLWQQHYSHAWWWHSQWSSGRSPACLQCSLQYFPW